MPGRAPANAIPLVLQLLQHKSVTGRGLLANLDVYVAEGRIGGRHGGCLALHNANALATWVEYCNTSSGVGPECLLVDDLGELLGQLI